MKINEIITEAGFWKGVGKGLSDIVAPGAWDSIRQQQAIKGFVNQPQKTRVQKPRTKKPKVALPQDPVQQATTSDPTIQPIRNPGAPTPAEQANLQQKIQAAMAAQK